MKKIIGILCVAAMVWAFVSSPAGAELGVGVKGGLNIANLTGDDVQDASTRMGLIIGGFIVYPINDVFGLRPEVLFSMQGAKMDVSDAVLGDYTSTTKLNYIEIPVLLNIMIPTQGNIHPCIFVGPAVGIKVGAEREVEDGATMSGTTDISNDVKSLDVGVAVGAGVGFPVGPGMVTLDGRYTLGLTTTDDSSAKADVKNSVIAVLAGYRFK